jgi:hypothetical protein
VVVDEAVAPAGALGELVHDLLHDAGDGEVERVGRLAGLEEDVGVLRGAAQHRRLRGQAPGAEGEDVVVATSARRSSSSSSGDLVDLVAGAEAVEEVQERHPGAQRGGVGDEREVVGLLHRAGGEHRPAGAAGVHHVAVVAEDRQRVGGDGAGGDVDDRRRELAGDLEHVGDHQQQALRRGERRGQRALLQRAVQAPGGAGLGLHLDHVGDRAPQVRRPAPPSRRRARPSARPG